MKKQQSLLVTLLLCLSVQLSFANSYEGYQKKALIIGNSDYAAYPNLPDIETDVKLLADNLYDIGFEVFQMENSQNVAAQIREFYLSASDSTVFFLYYSGYIGKVGDTPALVSVNTKANQPQLISLSDIYNYPNIPNHLNFVVLDWASLDTQKKQTNKLDKLNWEDWSGYPENNLEIQDYINRTFPNFTEKNVLALYHKSFHRDYDYTEKLVEGIQREDWALQDVFNQLEFDIPRTNSILGGWGGDLPITRSFLTGSQSLMEMEFFYLPPPKASAQYVLPEAYLNESKNLYEANQKIGAALDASGYYSFGYYHAPKGYAMVTKIERIYEDGTPFPDTIRWGIDHPIAPKKAFTLWSYLQSLFTAPRGVYRIMVFILTSEGVHQSDKKMSITEAKNFLSRGNSYLPNAFKGKPFTENHRCTVLIYEFVKPEYENAVLVDESKYEGRTHLEKNNFLRNLGILSDK